MDEPATPYLRPAARRLAGYAALFALLCTAAVLADAIPWQGDSQLYTLLELAATLVAADVGLMALVGYYSHQDDTFLLIGSGFLGAAFLNLYHAAVTSSYFAQLFPSAPSSLVPWSGLAPRLFLSVALFLSWAHWYRQEQLSRESAASAKAVYAIFAALTLLSLLLFAFVPLRAGIQADFIIPRPQEFLPLVFLALALAGYLRKGKWSFDPFEHWLVISLIVSLVGDATLALSARLNDAPYLLAHVLKIASFMAVYAGLRINIHTLCRHATNEAMILLGSATGAFVDLNQRLCDLFGYSRSEMLKLDLAAVSWTAPSYGAPELERRLGEGGVFDWPCKAKDGRLIWVELSLQRLRLDGADELLAATVRDITDRKRAEDELRRRDNILHAVTLAAAKLASPPLAANLPQALEIIGEALGVSRVMVVRDPLQPRPALVAAWQPPEFAVDFTKDAFAKIEAGALVHWLAPLARGRTIATTPRAADPRFAALLGGLKVESMLLVPIFAEDALWGLIGIEDSMSKRSWTAAETDTLGTLAKVIGSLVEREAAQASLRRSEEEFRTIFDSVTEGIALIDPATGLFVEVNPRVCAMVGYARDELVGRKVELVAPDVSLAVLADDVKAAAGGLYVALDRRLRAKDGHELWVDARLRIARFQARELALATVRDISGRKSAEEQLRRRDNILHAVTLAAAQLASPPLASNMPAALETIGEALAVSRIMVTRNLLDGGHEPHIVAAWQASDIAIDLRAPGILAIKDSAAAARWHAPLAKGEAIMTTARTADPVIQALLDGIGVKSILLLPIFAEGALWGLLGIDDCRTERGWASAETDALRTLAKVIGSLVEREATLASLHRSEEEFHTIFSSVSEGILVTDPATGRFLEVNPQACAMLGLAREELIGRTVEDVALSVSPEVVANHILASKRDGKPVTSEQQARTKDGHVFWAEVSVRSATFRGHEVALATLRDVTERKEAQDQIARMARVDALTGLPNRREFVDVLGREIARCQRDHTFCAVLYLDLDHFKDVNDTLGHPMGDMLLRAVAERLRSSIRAADSLARFGGDEFAVLQTDLHEPTDAALLAAKLVEAIAAPFPLDGNEVRSGASVGIAVQDGERNDAEAVLSYADVALYRAKAEGRGTYRFFTDAMDAEVRKRVAMAGELRQAIERDEIYLVYQPQVEIETDRIVGVEALVRWRHPRRGILPPSEFIPVAEDTGLIVALGKWVLRAACRQMRRWLDDGIAPDSIAVNVSAVQFKMPLELERDIAAILAESGVPPVRLELELTESVLMEVWREHNEMLQRLHRSGVRIAVDDFGIGYSSLDYLHRYPVDHLKIAQVFVADPHTDPGAMAIVKAAIGLAHDLNLGVIVEGVESPAQARQLRAWDCGEVQGYYYSKPLPAPEVARLLKIGRVSPVEEQEPVA